MCCRSQCKKRVPCIKTNVSSSRLFHVLLTRNNPWWRIDGGVPAAVGRAELLCQVDPGIRRAAAHIHIPRATALRALGFLNTAACVKSAPAPLRCARPRRRQRLNRWTWRIASAGRRRGPHAVPTTRWWCWILRCAFDRVSRSATRASCCSAGGLPRCAAPRAPPGVAIPPPRRGSV